MENDLSQFNDERINNDEMKKQIENAIQDLLDRHNSSKHYLLVGLSGFLVLVESDFNASKKLAADIIDHVFPSWKQEKNERGRAKNERPPVDYGIKTTALSHEADVDRFVEHVEQIKKTYYSDDETKTHDGPYFPFIQSSGMGKTKIMYEACQKLGEKEGWDCQLVLPENFTPLDNKNGSGFFQRIDLKVYEEADSGSSAATMVFEALDGAFLERQVPKVLFLCFDEAQAYLGTEEFAQGKEESAQGKEEFAQEKEDSAQGKEGTEKNKKSREKKKYRSFLFRCIRYWLRQKRPSLMIVACFSGTFASLVDLRFEKDPSLLWSASRDFVKYAGAHNQREFHSKGNQFFDVFVQTTTMGCLKDSVTNEKSSEYHRSVRFGRPLFTAFLNDGDLKEKELYILKRMLLSEDDWNNASLEALFSILGTRVQMGQTTFQIASRLVSKGYANVLSVGDNKVQICFISDPVCARLAMCMMDEEWKGDDDYCGRHKEWWNKKLQELFSHGICRPDKGDFGESMIALYMLMCGDVLRKKASADYTTFSVDLREWIRLLRFGGSGTEPETSLEDENILPAGKRKDLLASSRQSPRLAEQKAQSASRKRERAPQQATVTINFIQVTRNYLRGYGFDWAGFFCQDFLSHLYLSANAFYVFAGCPIVDFAAPIQIRYHDSAEGKEGKESYIPLLVSAKSHGYFSPADAKKECNRMKEAAEAVPMDVKLGALCLLVVFGSKVKSDDGDFTLTDSVVDELINGTVVCRVLRIPFNDTFNSTQCFVDISNDEVGRAEIFASHNFIRGYASDQLQEELKPEYALRCKPTESSRDCLKKLSEDLKVCTKLTKPTSEATSMDCS